MTRVNRHPPFVHGGAVLYHQRLGEREFNLRLAAMIRDAWAQCGHDVRPTVEPSGVEDAAVYWVVRLPNIINGMPPR